MKALLALLVSALAVQACGKNEKVNGAPDPNLSAGGASDVGAGGADSTSTGGCDSPAAFTIVGLPYNAASDCIEVDQVVNVEACTIRPGPDDNPNESDGFSCIERLSDGAQFWVFAFYRLGIDSSKWRLCDSRQGIPPKACYAAGCTGAPRSSCSLDDTRRVFSCGDADHEFDENCCARPNCVDSSDCMPGQECRGALSLGQWYCWNNSEGCDCGGPAGGPLRRVCLPIDSTLR
jgi:hypothetical protein